MKTLKLIGAALAAVTMTFTAQAAKTAKAVITDGGKTLKFVYDDVPPSGAKGTDWFSVSEADEAMWDAPQNCKPWCPYYHSALEGVETIVIDDSFADYTPRDCGSWFSWFPALKAVQGIRNLNLSQAQTVECLFCGCTGLEEIDLCGLDMSHITSTHYMFDGCKKLRTIVADFDLSSVTTMDNMFDSCESLERISVTSAFKMPDVNPSWDAVFFWCTNLVGGAGTAYNGAWTSGLYARIDGGVSAPGYFTAQNAPKPPLLAKAVVEDGGKTLRFVYDSVDYDLQGKTWYSLADYEETASSVKPEWHAHCGTVTNAVFDPSFAVCKPKTCDNWFYEFTQLVGVEGLENLDTSEATSYLSMFDSCSSLTSLDLSSLDTAKVADMCSMFWNCQSLTQLNLSGFDTAKVTDMDSMFEGCSSLTQLNLSGFDTAKVTGMAYMFCGCSSLTTLDVTSFDTANVTSMPYMFYGCSSLEAICASDRFVTDQVSDSYSMFKNCSKLVGGAGTAYDSAMTDADYARIDGKDGQPGYFTRGVAKIATGTYASLDLVDDLGIEIPDDVDYAAGDKVTIKVEGLAKGLKLVTTPVYEDPNAKKKVIADYIYTIEGVPTEPVDFEKQPMYARVTVTYKDKTKTADKTGKVETLQPVKLSIEPAEVRTLAAGALNAVYKPVDIAALWPEVADAKANPKDWSFKGWPAGIKYNATAKDASWSYKDDKATVKSTAAPYTVYGQPTKTGEYPITATWKHKLSDGKTTVSETFSVVLTVWGDDGASDFRAVSQAYVALTKNFGTGVTAMSGLPTGLKFTAKAVAATAKAPAQEAGDVYGTPTKPGVFAVTATLADKTKETFLWKVTEGENPGLDAAAIGWADAKVKFDGETKKVTILQGLEADFAVDASALADGAKVTVSGLPSGLKYDAKTGRITGIATKVESKVVTVKVVQNGVTEVRTFAIDIVANPFAGTYYAYLTDGSARETATAVLTPAVGGSVKVVLDEYVPSLGKTVKTTVSAKGFTMMKEYDPANPNAVQIAYDLELKANAKNNPDYASEVRALQLAFASVKREEGLVVFIGQLVLKTGNDITCWGMAQKALTAAECAEVVDAIGFAPQSVLTGVFTDAGGGHLLYASAVLDEQKMQYKVTGKLGDGTVVKVLLPIVYAFSEAAFDSAPCLLIEKGGAKRAYAMSFAHTKSDFAAKFWSHETAAAFQSCSAFDLEGITATAAEQLGGESELVLDAAELADFGYEGEAPVFRLMANGADLAKAKLDVYAPGVEEGAKPLASLASAKLQASAGYMFKGSFKWDAKVGGDGNTYSFELVPSAADGKTFVGRCEVKPAKGAAVVVGAWTRIPMGF